MIPENNSRNMHITNLLDLNAHEIWKKMEMSHLQAYIKNTSITQYCV
jgi:hypothetical protein